jgi:hypothetical protein
MSACIVGFDPTQPTGQQFTFGPDPINVPHGNHQVITWTLNPNNAPGAVFATNGVVFKPNSGWGASQPGAQGNSGTVFSVTEDNTNSGIEAIEYPYSVNVLYSGTTYTWDPEVANDPKGHVVFHPA